MHGVNSRGGGKWQRRSGPANRRNNQIGTGNCQVKGCSRLECSPREDYDVHLLNLAYPLFHSAQTQMDLCRESMHHFLVSVTRKSAYMPPRFDITPYTTIKMANFVAVPSLITLY